MREEQGGSLRGGSESVERFAGEGEENRGSERSVAAKRSISVDGKRTSIWSLCSTSLRCFLNTPSLRAFTQTHRHTAEARFDRVLFCATDIARVCLSLYNMNMALCHICSHRERRGPGKEQKVCVCV